MAGAGQQFDKSLRLLNAHDYKAVFDGASLKVSSPQILFLARLNGHTSPRLGLVIAKKNVRLAVERNRVKRIIRENFRQQQSQLEGLDIVVLARRGLDTLGNPELHSLCHELCTQLAKKANKAKAVKAEVKEA